MVNTTPIDSLRINVCWEKTRKSGLNLQQAENILALNPQLFCQQFDKKYPLLKWTAKYVFS